MTVNSLDGLNPVFHFLDKVIQDYGLYIFVGFVYALIPFSFWALSGGLRRKLLRGKPMPHFRPTIVIQLPGTPPPPPEPPFDPFLPLREPPDYYDHDDYPLD